MSSPHLLLLFLRRPFNCLVFFSSPGAPSTVVSRSDHAPEFCPSQPLPQASLHPGPSCTLLPGDVQSWKSLAPHGSVSLALAFVVRCLG